MMNVRERLLELLNRKGYQPLGEEDLAAELGLDGDGLKEFFRLLPTLEEEAVVVRTKNGRYGLPEQLGLLAGRLQMTARGFGFLLPDNKEEDDVYIGGDFLADAMHGDRILVRVMLSTGRQGRAREGEVLRVLSRSDRKIIGTYEESGKFGFVIPDDRKIDTDIFVAREDAAGARHGQKVAVKITVWPSRKRSVEGVVVEVLGFPGDPGIDMAALMLRHEVPRQFPPEVEAAAGQVPSVIQPEDLKGRRDLRQLPIVTIDGEDAKDLDDAVYVEKKSDNQYLLSVHIADVGFYVQEGSPLDMEARERATSVYLVDRVIPMLPPVLSNGICSLNAGADRLTLSAEMEFDRKGKLLRYELYPSVIHVVRRMTYTAVRKLLTENDPALQEEYRDLVPHFQVMEELCRILRGRRMKRGAIDFDFAEMKVKLDETGKPVELLKRERTIAESIIEEFMLAANETVAEHMSKLKVPFVFRIHEEPDPEKMLKLGNLLHNFGYQLERTAEMHPMILQKALSHISGRPEEKMVSTVMLRSLKQARYEAENVGHFGLAARYYTHFTSPIRRYPDLLVHRLLRESWRSGGMSDKGKKHWANLLPELAENSSIREREAAEAERESVALKVAEYMVDHVGEAYEGLISGVTAFGFFVELESGVEGLVHVANLDDDYYHYEEDQYRLIGERHHKVYRLGDAVKIVVVKVNLMERTIDFQLHPDFVPPREKSRRPEGKGGRNKKGAKETVGEKSRGGGRFDKGGGSSEKKKEKPKGPGGWKPQKGKGGGPTGADKGKKTAKRRKKR